MKKILAGCMAVCFSSVSANQVIGQPQKVVIIRHGEKPHKGDNLSCQGLNRALLLPNVLGAKIGIPSEIYVPALHEGKSTPRARMFETIAPFAIKNNLDINTKYEEEDAKGVAESVLKKSGTVLLVWEHRMIPSVVKKLGIKHTDLSWNDNDFDSMWIITFPKGVATLTKDSEHINPAKDCK